MYSINCIIRQRVRYLVGMEKKNLYIYIIHVIITPQFGDRNALVSGYYYPDHNLTYYQLPNLKLFQNDNHNII